MKEAFSGSCLCQKIQFEVASFSDQAANCHCTMCQKFHGAAFGTLVGVTGLVWLAGSDLLTVYRSSNGTQRFFCQCCGSSVGFLSAGAEESELELAIACFDEKIPVTIDAHIYLSSKACWYGIDDDLAKFENGRDGKMMPASANC